ncbi:hypothetical protein LDL08_32755 [Nonomuraea glycinis]|uniref:Uncharacterized protein n=1 Tax=Nonomuraea glycinis TaxID=2047744 RepID=A0A918ABA8_9ACTN|nr:hypothetical protein [Nonomuraea glycinis]MCA2180962.1 hypothetical protein [Nonomuraea glycinis]GGP13104.1 hypothetical protein GCM10012278_63550 [Nonomuraea glycinis]
MSFGTFARQVRDPALPHRWRVSAFRSCVQLYRPIGFEATLSFVESRAGRFQRDEAALLRALDLVEAGRAAWHAELQTYAARRREAKKRGRRSPRAEEANPNIQARWYWYGAPREAALHALWFWRRKRLPDLMPSTDPVLLEISACVNEILDVGAVLTEARCEAARLSELEHRLYAWDLLTVVRHLEVASGLR